jgi:UDP-N-acetylglucosamine:LPS N-acetylglucosamine transferase
VIPQIKDLPGRKVVLLGKPSDNRVMVPDNDTTVYSYVSYKDKAEMMSGSKFIVCRSGYTTMMDLAEIGLANGLFIPTPGQWEQEYLSSYYRRKGWFMSRNQSGLRLSRDIEKADGYTGFPEMTHTEDNVKKLYQEHLTRYLE